MDSPDRGFHFRPAIFDLALFFILNIRAGDRQTTVLGRLLVGNHDALGLLVQVGSFAELLDGLVEAGLGFLEALVGRRLGLLGFLASLLLIDLGFGFDRFQGTVLTAALPQGDERIVPG